MAIVYYWENGRWHRVASYATETAIKVVNDLLLYHLLGVFEMCAIDSVTGEVIASNELRNL